MLVLGIDTSCDDTSAAVVEDGKKIASNVVSSQVGIHKKYGGIVPELASRRHIEMIWPVVDEALKSAGTQLGEITAVGVCYGPGLIGSLLVGCSFAKSLCYSMGIPLVSVNHLEGHIFSSFLEEGGPLGERGSRSGTPAFPFISLIVSGGHTSLYRVDAAGKYKELGRTRDDAAGEAYDKVAKLLGLGYPGGPVIDRLAQEGDPDAVDFPRAYLPGDFDFSFSGLKTAVLNFLRAMGSGKANAPMPPDFESLSANSQLIRDICAGFQQAVVDVLIRKTEWAAEREKIDTVTVSGGVAANSSLRSGMTLMAKRKGMELFIPPPALCTDNAAMIGAAAYHRFISGDLAGMDLNPVAHLPL